MSGALGASAPGKLVVLGEYAVLTGAPGLVCAVDRRARVTRHASPVSDWQIRMRPGGATTTPPPLLRAVAAELGWRDALALDLDTRDFYDAQERKLGFGSSAALAAALVACLDDDALDEAGQPGCAGFATAQAAHRRFQSGAGSGIDVAAAWYGGWLAFRPAPSGTPEVLAVQWPGRIRAEVVWTGRSASTTDRLARLDRFLADSPAAGTRLLDELGQQAEAAIARLPHDADGFLAAARDFTGALQQLSDAAGLSVWTTEHQRARQLAERHGLLYKTSGAGGGDCGLALGRQADAWRAFHRDLDALGLAHWPLAVSDTGVAREGG